MKEKQSVWNVLAFLIVLSVIIEYLSAPFAGTSKLLMSIFYAARGVAFPGIMLVMGHKAPSEARKKDATIRYGFRYVYAFALSCALVWLIRVAFGMPCDKAWFLQDTSIQLVLCIAVAYYVYALFQGAPASVLFVGSLVLSLAMDFVDISQVYGLSMLLGGLPFYFLGVWLTKAELSDVMKKNAVVRFAIVLILAYGAAMIFRPEWFAKLMELMPSAVQAQTVEPGVGRLVAHLLQIGLAVVMLASLYAFPSANLTSMKNMGARPFYAMVLLPAWVAFMLQGWFVGILKTITEAHWLILYVPAIALLAVALCTWTAGVFVHMLMYPLYVTKENSLFIRSAFHNMTKYRYLLYELIKKGIVLKYRRSFLGILWSLIEPLLTMIVLTYVFGNFFGKNDPMYAVYILTGRLMFTLFQNTTKESLRSVRANAAMIKKVYVPKYMYPISTIMYNFVLFLISLIDLGLVMLYFKVPITWHLLEGLLPILVLLLISIGVGMILATINVFFRDIEYLWNVFTLLLMYCSAIFYQADVLANTSAGWILEINPVYLMIYNLRRTVMYGQGLQWNSMLFSTLFAFVILFVGFSVFYKRQDEFILHI